MATPSPPLPPTMENTQQENQDPVVHGKIDIDLKRASSSRYLGVRQRPSGRWVAEIKESAKKLRLWLGTFDTPQEAALAFDTAARLLRGPNAKTNFPLLLHHHHHKSNSDRVMLHRLVHHTISKKKKQQQKKKRMLNNIISWHGCNASVEDTIVCPSSSDDRQYSSSKVYSSIVVAPTFTSSTASSPCQGGETIGLVSGHHCQSVTKCQ